MEHVSFRHFDYLRSWVDKKQLEAVSLFYLNAQSWQPCEPSETLIFNLSRCFPRKEIRKSRKLRENTLIIHHKVRDAHLEFIDYVSALEVV